MTVDQFGKSKILKRESDEEGVNLITVITVTRVKQ